MEQDLTNLGLGSAVVILIIKQLFDYLKSRDSVSNNVEIEKAIYKLSINMELQTRILERISNKLETR